MNTAQISLEHTRRFNRLTLDYIEGTEKLKEFYYLPHELESYKEQIAKRKQFPVDRELLVNSLKEQYKSIGGCKGSVLDNVSSLHDDRTFTVTTGHQLNIFTGPLYFIYKIFHTIRLAEELQKNYPDQHFVPVYWMNSEDHDLEEVGQFNLFGKKYAWKTEQTGSTGRMNPASLSDLCLQLEAIFQGNEKALKMVGMFKHAYSEFNDLATATRYFANELFGDYGLVIIDSDDAGLKKSFENIIKQDLFESKPFEFVKQTSLKLKAEGYHVQVNPREINVFYLDDGIRNRIVRTSKGFHVLHTDIRFTEQELTEELSNNPEKFSPNVVLRPLFQEHILPNVAYVGGAGELSYWLQYCSCFKELHVSFPLLSLRNHFLVVDSASDSRMKELKLLPEDLFHSIDDLIKVHLLELADTDMDLSEEIKQVSALYNALKTKAAYSDTTLVGSLEAEEKKLLKGIQQWGSRFSRGLKKKNEVSLNRIRKIHSKLFPEGYLQERHDNVLSFYANDGDAFFAEVYKHTKPFSKQFQVLSTEK